MDKTSLILNWGTNRRALVHELAQCDFIVDLLFDRVQLRHQLSPHHLVVENLMQPYHGMISFRESRGRGPAVAVGSTIA